MKTYPAEGTKVIHKTCGAGTVQKLLEEFHPHHKDSGLVYVDFDFNPGNPHLVDMEALSTSIAN
jgi:hypothetical protein